MVRHSIEVCDVLGMSFHHRYLLFLVCQSIMSICWYMTRHTIMGTCLTFQLLKPALDVVKMTLVKREETEGETVEPR